MLLLGIEWAVAATRAGRPGGWRLIAVSGALAVYAGFPEVAYINTLMAVFWIAWRCGCLGRPALRPFLTKVALGGVAGTLLAAPMLVAMATYLPHADLGVHTGTHLGSVHLGPSALPQLLMPYVYGQVNADPHYVIWLRVGGYLSAPLLLFAALGLLARERRGLKLVLVGWGLLVFARIYGVPLLGQVLGVLPEISRIQFYRYGTAALELPVILLAGLGLDDLARVPAHRRRLVWGALAMIAVIVIAAFGARPIVHSLGTRFPHGAFFHVSIIWASVAVVAAAAVAFVRSARSRAALLTLIVAVDAIVLFAVPEFAAPRSTKVDLAPVAYLRRHLTEGRFFTLGPIAPDYGSYFGLASVSVDDFPPRAYAAFVHRRLDPVVAFTGFRPPGPSAAQELMRHLRGYRAAGVSYVLTPAGHPLPERSTGLRLVFRSPSTWIYHLAGALPYFGAAGCLTTSGARDERARCLFTAVDARSSRDLARRLERATRWSPDGHPTRGRALPSRHCASRLAPRHVQLHAARDGVGAAGPARRLRPDARPHGSAPVRLPRSGDRRSPDLVSLHEQSYG